ncbi:hypothetical protein P8452_27148 [Trifolium repens]|nr:hypothetical protein P8452_27148 [Trifolium repens]
MIMIMAEAPSKTFISEVDHDYKSFLIASNRKPQFGFELKSQTVPSRLNFSFLLASDRSSARLKSSISLFTPQIPNCYSSHTPQIPN